MWTALTITSFLLLAVYFGFKPVYRKLTAIRSDNGIELHEPIELNGSKQWLYIRGHKRTNPLLLFLHGGPGTVETPMARLFGRQVEKHFTVVHWDQRESGLSASGADVSDLTVAQFEDDCRTLIQALLQRFNQPKLVLVGHSWGSILGTKIATLHPQLVSVYVGLGQSVNIARAEVESYAYVRQQAQQQNLPQAIIELDGLSLPYQSFAQLLIQRKWLMKLGGVLSAKDQWRTNLAYLASPEYTFAQIRQVGPNANKLLQVMWSELMTIELDQSCTQFAMPVLFIAGKHDYNTPSNIVEAYVNAIQAPHKELIWFDHSGHAPNVSEADKYQSVLIEKVLPLHLDAVKTS